MFAGLETKLIAAAIFVVMLLSTFAYIHHLNNKIASQDATVAQLKIISNQKDVAIDQLRLNAINVQKRIDVAASATANVNTAVVQQSEQTKQKQEQFKKIYTTSSSIVEKQAILNKDNYRRFWCAGELTIQPKERASTYKADCFPTISASKTKK